MGSRREETVYHVVCHGCEYEDGRVLAALSEIAHRKRTHHKVEYEEVSPLR